jgi:hypothetical protein
MTKFEELLKSLEEIVRVKERIDHDKKMMEEMLEEIKVKLLEEMPTDTYSNSRVSLSKQRDYKLKIDTKMLDPEYLEEVPNKKQIKETISFGIPVKGVTADEVIRLLIRIKNAEED